MVWPIQQVKRTDDTEIFGQQVNRPISADNERNIKKLAAKIYRSGFTHICTYIFSRRSKNPVWQVIKKVRKINLGSVILVFATRRAPN